MTREQCLKCLDKLKDAGFRHAHIADRLGCNPAAVGRWRKGGRMSRVLEVRLMAWMRDLQEADSVVVQLFPDKAG